MKNALLVFLAAVALVSCDFSGLLMKDAGTAGGSSVPPDTKSYMTSFKILVSNNSSAISSDIVAFINADERKIYFSVPFNVYNNNLALIPTITVSNGGTYSPTGAQYFKFPVTYDVIQGDTIITYTTSVTTTP